MDENIKQTGEELKEEINPTPQPENPSGKPAKNFSQDDLNRIVEERLAKHTKSVYNKAGAKDETEFNSILEKAKKYDDLEKQVSNLTEENEQFKKKEIESNYRKQLSSVDEEYADVVFTKLPPEEGEKLEDYKGRVDSYLEAHPKLAKGSVVGKIETNPNLTGENKDNSLSRIAKAMGLK